MHYLYIQYSKDLNSVHSSKKKTMNLPELVSIIPVGSFQVKCAVRLKVVPEGPPGPLSILSENFFAGIQV